MSDGLSHVVRWSAWNGADAGLEHLDLIEGPEGIVASGLVVGSTDRGPFGLSYRLILDPGWRLRGATLATTAGGRLSLAADGCGGWQDGVGRARAEFEGCIDIDIEATPFTNTLPIRRLRLGPGESATVRVAYVSLPGLELTCARQRYTALDGGGLYRFESLDGAFTADLQVDAQGVVVDYPGLFRRTAVASQRGQGP